MKKNFGGENCFQIYFITYYYLYKKLCFIKKLKKDSKEYINLYLKKYIINQINYGITKNALFYFVFVVAISKIAIYSLFTTEIVN